MRAKSKYEEIIIKEIREFPQSKLPQIIKLLHSVKSRILPREKRRLIRQPHRSKAESLMGSFKGYLSSSEEFSIRKEEEKELE